MTLALAPQCCCGGPGIARVPYQGPAVLDQLSVTLRYVYPATDVYDTFYTHHWPCWAWPRLFGSGGIDTDYTGWQTLTNAIFSPLSGTILGYDYQKNWLIYTPDNYTSVYALQVGACDTGESPVSTLIDGATGASILAGTVPGGATSIDFNGWVGAVGGRIFGQSRYTESGTLKLKVWSVLYDGTDYQVEFTIAESGGHFPPACVTTQTDHLITQMSMGGSPPDIRIYDNGSLVDTYSHAGVTGADGYVDSTLKFGSQYLSLFTSGKLLLIESGTADLVQFVASEGGIDVDYTPKAMAYDPTKRAIVITWRDETGYGPGYTTYSYKPLSAGNIIDQDGTRIYANWYAGQGFSAPGASFWVRSPLPAGVAIPGKLPQALTVTAGVIEPPPPDPPKPVDCTDLTDCAYEYNLKALVWFTKFVDSLGWGPIVSTYGSNFYVDFLHERLNAYYGFRLAENTDPWGGGYVSTTNPYWFYCPLGEDGNYADPGILFTDFSYVDPNWRREDYIYGIYLKVTCSGDELTIDEIHFLFHGFLGDITNSTPGWDWPQVFGSDSISPTLDGSAKGSATPCHGNTFAAFTYPFDYGYGTVGDFSVADDTQIFVYAQLWAQP